MPNNNPSPEIVQSEVCINSKRYQYSNNKVLTWLNSYFRLDQRNAVIKKEIIGGLTTFLAMSYILAVNPAILSGSGMNYSALFLATALSSFLATFVMGLAANVPIGLAPGLGGNVFFTSTLVKQMHLDWSVGLTAVFISCIIFTIISLTSLREKIILAIPQSLKIAIGVGIGFFIAFVGLKNMGVLTTGSGIALNHLDKSYILLGLGLVVLIFILHILKIPGSVLITITVGLVIGVILSVSKERYFSSLTANWSWKYDDLNAFKTIFGACFTSFTTGWVHPSFYIAILTFFLADFFSATGTLLAVGNQLKTFDKHDSYYCSKSYFLVDALAGVGGSILGTTTVTAFVESTAGVAQGAKTGLSAIVCSFFFLLAIALFPLFQLLMPFNPQDSSVSTVSVFTSPALILVGAVMIPSIKDVEWKRPEIVASVFITIIFILLVNIATGIAFGMLLYTFLMLVRRKVNEISVFIWILDVLFIIYFVISEINIPNL